MNSLKSISLVVFFLFLFTASAMAQICWKISGNGLTKPSYLFGTHHLIEKTKVPNFKEYINLVAQTDVVLGELDMKSKKDMQSAVMLQAMMTTDIKELLTDTEYALVDKRFTDVMGVGMSRLGKMKPMLLSTMYSVVLYMKQSNITSEIESIDNLFQTEAKRLKKEVKALESIDQQITMLLNTIPLKRQAEILVKTVEDNDKSITMLSVINSLYLKGDLNGMYNLSKEEKQMNEAEEKLFVTDRNNAWVTQLATLMPQQSCFIAVGCLHLAGDSGLIKQLQSKGYTVEAVTF